MTAAIAIIPMLIGAGMAVDYSKGVGIGQDLQVSADGAALAAMASGETDQSQLTIIANDYFDANFGRLQPSLQPTVSVAFGQDTITVAANAPVSTSFMTLAGINSYDATANSTALRKEGEPVCLLALNSSAQNAIHFQGNMTLDAIGCSVQTNSTSPQALKSEGSVVVSADNFCAVGGFDGNEMNPTPKTGCALLDDPYADLVPPTFSGCDHTSMSYPDGTATATPGTYCGGITFTSHSDVTFQPGLYVIHDGKMFMAAQSSLTGTDVTLYFTGTNTELDIAGQASIDVTAPATGDYAGVVFAQDPTSNPNNISKIVGGGNIRVVGSVYFPTWTLDFGGTAAMLANSPAVSLVADSFIFRGDSQLALKSDEVSAGLPENPVETKPVIRLIQ